MLETLRHSPANILARALVAKGIGSDPSTAGAWPVRFAAEVDSPDQTVTVYDHEGDGQGRSMIDGTAWEYPGVQVRVRSALYPAGWGKANAVRDCLARQIHQTQIAISGSTYVVHCAVSLGGVLASREAEAAGRYLFFVNCGLSVYQLN